jgi:chitinase
MNYQAYGWSNNNPPSANQGPIGSGSPWVAAGGCNDTYAGSGLGRVISANDLAALFNSQYGMAATYAYADLVTAANTYYPAFCNTGTLDDMRRECAAAFANFRQETGSGQYDHELNTSPYCDTSMTSYQCPYDGNTYCASGALYFGRHAIQISWNYNYCSLSAPTTNNPPGIGVNVHGNPEQLLSDRVIGWRASLWYWMTQIGPNIAGWPLETAHAAILPGTHGGSGNYGFGGTIRAINGVIECNSGSAQQQNRINYYQGTAQVPLAGTLDILGYSGAAFGRDTCF